MRRISLSRNVLFGFLSWLVPVGVTVLLTPLIVHGLGAEAYGLYALVMGFVAYSFTFNVGRAITRYVALYRASGETDRLTEVLSTTLMLNLVVGGLSASALALSSGVLVRDVLKISPAHQATARLALYMASIGLLLTMVSQVFNAVPQAVQRFDVYSLIVTCTGIVTIGGNGLLVWMGYGAITLVAWNVLSTGLSCIAYLVASRRLLPDAHFTFRIRKDLLRGIVRFSGAVIAYQVLANLLLLFERGWLTRSLGSAAVTFYVVPMAIAIYIHAFISSLTLVLFPLASEAGASKDFDRLRKIYTRAFKYISLLVVFMVVTLSVGSHRILANWMGSPFADQAAPVMTIQVIAFGMMAMLVVPWQIADGLGFPWANALLGSWWLVCAIIFGILLTPMLGIRGMAYSRLIGMTVAPFFVLFVERRVFGHNLWSFWRQLGLSLIISAGLMGLGQYFLFRNIPPGWTWLVLSVAASGLTFVGLLLLTRYMNDEEQLWLKSFFSRLAVNNL
jgi:O-antigen/teichoic acid export membrane protein